MKAVFLGDFAATVAPLILGKVKAPIETDILARHVARLYEFESLNVPERTGA